MSIWPAASVLVSAVLFGLTAPAAKLLLDDLHPVALAGLLYAGAFLGLAAFRGASRLARRGPRAVAPPADAPLGREDLPWLAGAILAGGIVAPIALLFGLGRLSGLAGALLLNFEAAATALFAVLLFKESAGRRLWLALVLMTAGGVLLSWDGGRGRLDLVGPLLVLLAMAGWGLDNNLTRQISGKDPVQIALVKGLVSGTVSLGLAFSFGWGFGPSLAAVSGLVVGAAGYGLSLILFIRGLRDLGAFRTGALFSVAPFAGAAASIPLLGDRLRPTTAAAGLFMAAGAVLVVLERHVHPHRHGRVTHSHAHVHSDLHHGHRHEGPVREPHAHEHTHDEVEHAHVHRPDIHHRHPH